MPAPTPQAFPTTGCVLAIGNDDSPETYDQIAQVGDIADTGGTTNMHDTSSHDTRGFASQIPGLKKQTDVKFKLWFNPENPQHAFDVEGGLGALYVAGTLKAFLFYPPGFATKAKTFFGYVTEVGQPGPVDGVLMLNVTIAPTGAPTFGVDATVDGLVNLVEA